MIIVSFGPCAAVVASATSAVEDFNRVGTQLNPTLGL